MDKNKEHKCNCCTSCSEDLVSDENPNVVSWKVYIPICLSLVMLLVGIVGDNYINKSLGSYVRLLWYLIAYIPVAYPVFREALNTIRQKDFFTEYTLMIIATSGAFLIGEYPEGIAVMLFYTIGELFQGYAVNKAKKNVKAILDVRPDTATVKRNDSYETIKATDAIIGDVIEIKAGEKIPLDGILISETSSFNASALTGESKPKIINSGEVVLAGMINLDKIVYTKVSKKYEDSTFSRILEMVQDAVSKKAKTELLIRRFAKIYTPIVFILSLLITLVPFFIVHDYIYEDWLYRALVFLVISCPCALVVSIPLGYFGGIGAASKEGILFKGANYLDLMTKVNTVVIDKTGTLTNGVFDVQNIVLSNGFNEEIFMNTIVSLEKYSNHPIAKAIVSYWGSRFDDYSATDVHEISGKGLSGKIKGKKVLAGNTKLMDNNDIVYDSSIISIAETVVIVAINKVYAGYITIADEIKPDSIRAIQGMRNNGIRTIVMLSGDKSSITKSVASDLKIDKAYGDLLPEGKIKHLEVLKKDEKNVIAFVGDGINDTPSLALSDVGIAMGGIGSDAAIEVADVVIQTDEPSKIVTAIRVAKSTEQIVYQNIILAFSVKLIVLVLGGFGIANMWEAVFADVGVSLLAILNAIRILKMRFE